MQEFASSGPAYDPVIVTTSHDCILAVMTYNENQIDGTLIKSTDKKVYLSTENLTIVPSGQNKLVIQGVTHSIESIAPLRPAGIDVYYEVQARA